MLTWFSKLQLQNSACLHVLSQIAHTIPTDFLHHFLVASWSKYSSTSWKRRVVGPSNYLKWMVLADKSPPSHWKLIDIQEPQNCKACVQSACMQRHAKMKRLALMLRPACNLKDVAGCFISSWSQCVYIERAHETCTVELRVHNHSPAETQTPFMRKTLTHAEF